MTDDSINTLAMLLGGWVGFFIATFIVGKTRPEVLPTMVTLCKGVSVLFAVCFIGLSLVVFPRNGMAGGVFVVIGVLGLVSFRLADKLLGERPSQ